MIYHCVKLHMRRGPSATDIERYQTHSLTSISHVSHFIVC